MADAHKNFASSLVATAPSPATSGTSLVVTTGEGTKFPTAPFNATIWPAGATPTTANAEIVRVTAVSTDTLTITRAQESTSARTVIVGDQIVAGITAKTLTDVETPGQSLRDTYLRPSAAAAETFPRHTPMGTGGPGANLLGGAIALPSGLSVGHIAFLSVGANASATHWWFGLFDSSFAMLAVTADQTSTAWGASSIASLAVATIASGASSTFTTTYTGFYYVAAIQTASTAATLAINNGSATAGNLSPVSGWFKAGVSTTPPAFPFTVASPSNNGGQIPYAYVGA